MRLSGKYDSLLDSEYLSIRVQVCVNTSMSIPRYEGKYKRDCESG